ncbi:HAD family hydrolase [Hydrotalea sandarakina]|jgi:putative hydrolase of the HAD superfamily|uniref:Putative hydrolase of the HAD superfamily n=1 Tax=Hydrotalea sandarakina TaxID=1004304 RepID=A0A2W7RNZ1_9BACT|nr:HAD family phosphatase [Hydrotalea sandarakina]PZX60676.1 putative hydrolase of the HAD superfamily [Hydrotalea sandarakina]
MKKVHNIIFDLGGVFINLDFQKTTQAFQQLGIQNFQQFFSQNHSNDLFIALETGKITANEFFELLRKTTGINADNQTITDAWNAMLLNFPPERIEWLNKINKQYPVYLFSNTNIIHYNCFMQLFQRDVGMQNFNEQFLKAYYSHEMGMRKPDADGFEYILQQNNLKPEETLFIDDTLANINTAKALGFQTIHLTAPQTVLDLRL